MKNGTVQEFYERIEFEYEYENSIAKVKLKSWEEFSNVVLMFKDKDIICRGQSSSSYKLESSLTRMIKNNKDTDLLMKRQFDKFKFMTKGRFDTANKEDDNFWAIGQHFGLATPLLDWTTSPYIALFFAFEKEKTNTSHRSVFFLKRSTILDNQEENSNIKIIQSNYDDNHRVIAQAGLFTKVKDIRKTVDDAIKIDFNKKKSTESIILLRVDIPNLEKDREDCLKYLNKANINQATLFPDLEGVSKFCNTSLEINNYSF